jgi:hypothetical protein
VNDLGLVHTKTHQLVEEMVLFTSNSDTVFNEIYIHALL